MYRRILILLLLAVCGLLTPSTINAQQTPNCRPLFGGGPSCVQSGKLTLDKKIRHPGTNQFIDNAEVSDLTFSPDQAVVFQVTVRNTDTKALEDITVTDIFPQYVAFTRGPGQFDHATGTLTYEIANLAAGQTNTITLEGKVSPLNALPNASGPICAVNQATATQGRNTGSDNAQFCIQRSGTTTPQTPQPGQTTQGVTPGQPQQPPVLSTPNMTVSPKTGPEMLSLIGLIPAGLTGFYLRRKTSK